MLQFLNWQFAENIIIWIFVFLSFAVLSLISFYCFIVFEWVLLISFSFYDNISYIVLIINIPPHFNLLLHTIKLSTTLLKLQILKHCRCLNGGCLYEDMYIYTYFYLLLRFWNYSERCGPVTEKFAWYTLCKNVFRSCCCFLNHLFKVNLLK